MRIEKKIWPEAFQKVLDGDKTFELRLADWECSPGDILVLNEWDPKINDYTGRQLEKEVGHIAYTKGAEDWGIYTKEELEKYGLMVISLK